MLDVITENIDIWSSTQMPNTSSGRGHSKNETDSKNGIERLRELILELAVRGKLVPLDPKDESASILLKKITNERERLINEGTIKKQKSTPEIAKKKVPFEIPVSWKWIRLDSAGYTQTGGTPSKNKKEYFGKDIPFIKPGDIYQNYVDYENEGLSNKGKNSLDRTAISGSILMVCIGTIGKCNVIDKNCTFNQQINSVTPYLIDSNYLLNVIRSNYFQNEAWERSSSTTIAILNKGNWEGILIPLAPLAEQHRIVSKVDELMALCDQLEQVQADSNTTHQTLVETLLGTLTASDDNKELQENWSRIEKHLNTLFITEYSIEQLKQTILQLAVMGKLVPQEPNEQPACMLLKQIAKEKTLLIMDGKVKKQKTLPIVSDDEKPYTIPISWEWTRLGNISLINPRNEAEGKTLVSFVPMHLISNSHTGDHGQEEREWESVKKGYTHFADGDIGLAKITPCFENSKAVVFSNLLNGIGAGTTELHIARPYGKTMCPKYILLYLKTPNFMLVGKAKMTGTAGQKRLPKHFFSENPLPLPPLNEQHRIVSKVDELMALCNALKSKISNAQTTQVQLAGAIVEIAVSF